jgi:hypothetical protein
MTFSMRSLKKLLEYNGVGPNDNLNPGNGFLVFSKHNKLLEIDLLGLSALPCQCFEFNR